MATVNVNIRMDSDLKHEFEDFCLDKGLSMSAAFNVFAKQAVRENRIPFEIRGDRPNEETTQALREVRDMRMGIKNSKIYTSTSEMLEEILSDEI